MAVSAPWVGTPVVGNTTYTAATSAIVNFSGATDGEVVFLIGTVGDAQTAAISAPAGWTLLDQSSEGTSGGSSSRTAIFWRVKQSGDTTVTPSWTVSTGYEWVAVSWPGVNTTTPIDGTVAWLAHTTGTTYTTGTATPSQAEWAVGVFSARGSTAVVAWTPDAALTERVDVVATTSPFIGLEVADSNGNATVASHSYTATGQTASHGLGALFYLNAAAVNVDPGWGHYLLEDGTGALVLEDGTGDYLLDTSASAPVSLSRSESDTGAGSDAVAQVTVQPRTASDAGAGSDAVVRSAALRARSVSDTGAGSDTTSASVTHAPILRSATDAAAGSDAVVQRTAQPRTANDTGAGTDAVTAGLVRVRAATDAGAGTDTTAMFLVRARALSELGSGTDAVVQRTAQARALTDDTFGTDVVSAGVITAGDPTPEQILTATGTTTTAPGTTIFTTTADIAVGKRIVIGFNRATLSGTTNGISNVLTSAGALTWTLAAGSVRASTHDDRLMMATCTTLIPAGSTITVQSTNGSSARRAAVLAVFPATVLSETADATSGATTGGDGATSYGAQGSSLTSSASVTTAGTNEIVFSAQTYGITQPSPSVGSGWTEIGRAVTSVGSSDRGVVLFYRVVRAAGTYTPTMDLGVSGGWAATAASFPISAGASLLSRSVSDSGAGTDATSRALSQARAETDATAGTDSVARASSRARSLSETGSGTDSSTRATVIPRPITETGAGSDTVVRSAQVLARSSSNAAGGTDVTVRTQPSESRSVSDASSGVDATIRSLSQARSSSDASGGTDTQARQVVRTRAISELGSGTDAASRALSQARAETDSGSGSDSVSTSTTGRVTRSETDSGAGSDTTSRVLSFARTSSNASAGTDSQARVLAEARALSELGSGSDAVAQSSTHIIRVSLSELGSGVDTTARTTLRSRAAGDTAATTDVVLRQMVRARSITDVAGGAETLARTQFFGRSRAETANGSDALEAVYHQYNAAVGIDLTLTVGPAKLSTPGVGPTTSRAQTVLGAVRAARQASPGSPTSSTPTVGAAHTRPQATVGAPGSAWKVGPARTERGA